MENAEEVTPVNTVEEQASAPADEMPEATEDEEIEEIEETQEQAGDEGADESAEPTEEEKAKLKDMEAQRDVLNNDAEKHRILRDELNARTKEWKANRDALNGQVRELVEEAGKYRETRDQFNQQVRDNKAVRDEWNRKVSEIRAKINELRPERPEDRGEVSVSQMKRDLERMEQQQQTTVLSADKEKALVKSIADLAKKIGERERTFEGDDQIRDLVEQLRDAKTHAEGAHHAVSEAAEKAQGAHDRMLSLYQRADAVRKEADAAQAKFVECKQAADEEHRLHIEGIKSVHSLSKDADAIRNKKRDAKKRRADVESKKEAKIIFEKFKAGEKLSTEDLMTLQKSGYL